MGQNHHVFLKGRAIWKAFYIGSVSNYFSSSHNCVALSSRSAVVDNVHVNYFKMLLKPNRPKKLELLLWINFKGSIGPFHEKWENIGHSQFKFYVEPSPGIDKKGAPSQVWRSETESKVHAPHFSFHSAQFSGSRPGPTMIRLTLSVGQCTLNNNSTWSSDGI